MFNLAASVSLVLLGLEYIFNFGYVYSVITGIAIIISGVALYIERSTRII